MRSHLTFSQLTFCGSGLAALLANTMWSLELRDTRSFSMSGSVVVLRSVRSWDVDLPLGISSDDGQERLVLLPANNSVVEFLFQPSTYSGLRGTCIAAHFRNNSLAATFCAPVHAGKLRINFNTTNALVGQPISTVFTVVGSDGTAIPDVDQQYQIQLWPVPPKLTIYPPLAIAISRSDSVPTASFSIRVNASTPAYLITIDAPGRFEFLVQESNDTFVVKVNADAPLFIGSGEHLCAADDTCVLRLFCHDMSTSMLMYRLPNVTLHSDSDLITVPDSPLVINGYGSFEVSVYISSRAKLNSFLSVTVRPDWWWHRC